VPELSIQHLKLRALHDLWVELKGERELPARSDFSFAAFKPWLGHIGLMDVVGELPRFRIRLLGTRLVEYAGADHTGRWLDQCVPADHVEEAVEPYRTCVHTRAPVVRMSRYVNPVATKSMLERLLLPCSSDGRVIDIVLAAAYAETQPEERRERR
jgi:hypothetical protein